jgi:hypothetical protein
MTAHWYGSELHKAERGNLLFASAQASLMRQHVLARTRLTQQLAGARVWKVLTQNTFAARDRP